MFKLEVIHNKSLLNDFEEWAKDSKIPGYTCFQVHKSYGSFHGAFTGDAISAELYQTIIYFARDQEALVKKMAKCLNEKDCFVLLQEVQEVKV